MEYKNYIKGYKKILKKLENGNLKIISLKSEG